MFINGREIKSIRPMTVREKSEYDNCGYLIDSVIFCIEFIDGNILLPKWDCISCMKNSKCLFTLATEIQ